MELACGKEKELQELRDEIKRYRMKLSAIKVLVHHERPVCQEKLQRLLEECENCKEEENETRCQ